MKMSVLHIKESVERVINHYKENPDDISTLGFLGIDDSIPAGDPSLRLIFRIGAENETLERQRELIKWIEAHSPVGDSASRAIPIKVDVEVV
jgi:hypothetical protein